MVAVAPVSVMLPTETDGAPGGCSAAVVVNVPDAAELVSPAPSALTAKVYCVLAVSPVRFTDVLVVLVQEPDPSRHS